MFMINDLGQTPLDICIDQEFNMPLDQTGFVDETNDGIDVIANAITKKGKDTKKSNHVLELLMAMKTYEPNCSIKFLKYPHRLDLKFEKSYAMAVKQNRSALLDKFGLN